MGLVRGTRKSCMYVVGMYVVGTYLVCMYLSMYVRVGSSTMPREFGKRGSGSDERPELTVRDVDWLLAMSVAFSRSAPSGWHAAVCGGGGGDKRQCRAWQLRQLASSNPIFCSTQLINSPYLISHICTIRHRSAPPRKHPTSRMSQRVRVRQSRTRHAVIPGR